MSRPELVDEADALLAAAWDQTIIHEKIDLLRKARDRYLRAGLDATARRVEWMLSSCQLRMSGECGPRTS